MCLIEKELIRFLKRIAKILGNKFSLRYNSLEAMRKNDNLWKKSDAYCTEDREIRIKIKNRNGYKTIEYLIDSLVHEMAHLSDDFSRRYSHGIEWEDRYKAMMSWVKDNIL
jgi:hypothetical protein